MILPSSRRVLVVLGIPALIGLFTIINFKEQFDTGIIYLVMVVLGAFIYLNVK